MGQETELLRSRRFTSRSNATKVKVALINPGSVCGTLMLCKVCAGLDFVHLSGFQRDSSKSLVQIMHSIKLGQSGFGSLVYAKPKRWKSSFSLVLQKEC